ncbi:translocon-associated protein subunit beta isoform X2 [Cucurbita moschata]|uniref:Translocon-associated protein subunit beta n=1 Tax=Cucurbita moschata TaxID=3662 RepID=A0A6J1FAK9_CUCMO|nr:translocon-associated protein subunit beta isoform X1 [Cucurbita moschata]XP_022935420.1 translocon-associated protein subunit beta isoform X2 [Cucurbita moschata]
MANLIQARLIHLLLAFLFVSSTIASSDVPFIVAHKKATLTRLKSGVERVSVSIEIYNQGSSTAYDVTLNDASWPGDVFDIVSGETSKSWERLDAGGHLSHSFELEAKTKGMFHGSPAVITFRVPTKSALQEALSTPILPLDVLADRPPEKKFEWVKRLLAKYGSLISVVSFVVLFVYLVASPSKSAAKGSKKKR